MASPRPNRRNSGGRELEREHRGDQAGGHDRELVAKVGVLDGDTPAVRVGDELLPYYHRWKPSALKIPVIQGQIESIKRDLPLPPLQSLQVGRRDWKAYSLALAKALRNGDGAR